MFATPSIVRTDVSRQGSYPALAAYEVLVTLAEAGGRSSHCGILSATLLRYAADSPRDLDSIMRRNQSSDPRR